MIILIAIAGKLGGSMFMARLTGMKWRDSFSLGVLMNARGLVERSAFIRKKSAAKMSHGAGTIH